MGGPTIMDWFSQVSTWSNILPYIPAENIVDVSEVCSASKEVCRDVSNYMEEQLLGMFDISLKGLLDKCYVNFKLCGFLRKYLWERHHAAELVYEQNHLFRDRTLQGELIVCQNIQALLQCFSFTKETNGGGNFSLPELTAVVYNVANVWKIAEADQLQHIMLHNADICFELYMRFVGVLKKIKSGGQYKNEVLVRWDSVIHLCYDTDLQDFLEGCGLVRSGENIKEHKSLREEVLFDMLDACCAFTRFDKFMFHIFDHARLRPKYDGFSSEDDTGSEGIFSSDGENTSD